MKEYLTISILLLCFMLSTTTVIAQTPSNDFYIKSFNVFYSKGNIVLQINIWQDGVCNDYSKCSQDQSNFYKQASQGLEITIQYNYGSNLFNKTLKNVGGSTGTEISCSACVATNLIDHHQIYYITILNATQSLWTYNPSKNKVTTFAVGTPVTTSTTNNFIEINNKEQNQVYFSIIILLIMAIGMSVIVYNTRKEPKTITKIEVPEEFELKYKTLQKDYESLKENINAKMEEIGELQEQLDHEKELFNELNNENKRLELEKKILEKNRSTGQFVCMICKSPSKTVEEIIECPYCQTSFHKDHLLEWIKIKSSCPFCGEKLDKLIY